MTKKILVLVLLLSASAYSQQGWVLQQSGTTSALNYIQFINSATGFACGDGGTFLKTTNSGSNWNASTFNFGRLLSLQFLDASTGFVAADSGLYRSTNMGTSWTRISQGNMNTGAQYFHFIDYNTGYSENGACFKTTNAGVNWQQLGGVGPGIIRSFVYINDNNIHSSGWDYITQVGAYTARIIKSTNGGASWTENYYSPINICCSIVNDLSFPSITNGYGVGWETATDYFYKSTNSGVNWVKATLPVQMNSVAFTDNNTGWLAGGTGSIYYTSNSGANFIVQNSGTTFNLKKIFMLNNSTGWATGDGGTILSTTNGGFTAVVPVSGNVPETFSLYQNYPNPFNPSTKIKFSIPADGKRQTAEVKLIIYDAIGREITTIVNEQLQPGTYEAEWDASNYPSGVYFYQLAVNSEQLTKYTETKKLVLIK